MSTAPGPRAPAVRRPPRQAARRGHPRQPRLVLPGTGFPARTGLRRGRHAHGRRPVPRGRPAAGAALRRGPDRRAGGLAVPGQPGLRLQPRADVFAYAAAEGVTLRVDGTEVQVRRPAANRPGRRAFVSGKKKQNTIKATAVSDGEGRLLWLGAYRPGRMHDTTALPTEGIEDLLGRHPEFQAEVEPGYQGLARDFPRQ